MATYTSGGTGLTVSAGTTLTIGSAAASPQLVAAATAAIRLARAAYLAIQVARAAYKSEVDNECKECKFKVDIGALGKPANVRKDIIDYAILSNIWLKKHPGSSIRSTTTENIKHKLPSGEDANMTLRGFAGVYAKQFANAHPLEYPKGRTWVAGHVPDVCVTGDPDPESYGGWWVPMSKSANSTVAGVERHNKGRIDCFTVDGKNPLSLAA